MESTRPSGLIIRKDLTAQGIAPSEIRRSLGSGQMLPVRPGAYVPVEVLSGTRPEVRYRYFVRATVAAMSTGAVLSHESAAVMHGIPRIGPWPKVVHAVAERTSGGRSSAYIVRHGVRVMPEPVVVDGIAVTGVARTVVDLARTSTFVSGVASADHVLATGMATREQLEDALADVRRMHGYQRARQVIAFADERAQSVGESLSRVRMHQLGFPAPDLQVEFRDHLGFVARVDFWWEQLGLVGEFDGRGKYVPEGADPRLDTSEIVYHEKLREDRLRQLVSSVARWGWREAWNQELFASTLTRAGLPHRH